MNSEVRTFGTNSSVETLFAVNGKPYLRRRIRIGMSVWWPFCDFFGGIIILMLVKLALTKKRAKIIIKKCTRSLCKAHHFDKRKKKKSADSIDCATMHDKAGRSHTHSLHYYGEGAGNHANNFFFALLIFHLMHVSPQLLLPPSSYYARSVFWGSKILNAKFS